MGTVKHLNGFQELALPWTGKDKIYSILETGIHMLADRSYVA